MQVWLDLKLPDYMSEITVLVQTKGSAMSEIWKAGGYMLLCALGSLVSSCVVGFFVARIAAGISKRLRSLVYDKVQSFSVAEIGKFSTASLITRTTNDVMQVQMLMLKSTFLKHGRHAQTTLKRLYSRAKELTLKAS